MTKAKKRGFPLPSEIDPVAGAEKAAEMYPPFTRVIPEDDKRFWFYNAMHFPEAMPPFDNICAQGPYTSLGAFTGRMFVFPTVTGMQYRIINGRIYLSSDPVTDPAEIEHRLVHFQERASFYYSNWDHLYEQWKLKITGLINDMEATKIPELPEFEDIDTLKGARGVAQNQDIQSAYNRCVEGYLQMWHYHMEFIMLGYGAYLTFFQFCRKVFPEISDQTVARMTTGVDVLMFKPDNELRRLARLAVEMGVDGEFTAERKPGEIVAALEKAGYAGLNWLQELEKAKDPWFQVSNGDGYYHHHRSWNDSPELPFAALTRYIGLVKQGENIERDMDKMHAERERLISEYRELIYAPEELETFDQMLLLTQKVFPFVEDHKFYCEHWLTSVFFSKVRELAKLMLRYGMIADIEDVFYLNHYEVSQALGEVALAWSTSQSIASRGYWARLVEERKPMLQKLREWDPPPALGPVPENIDDPVMQMLWGITPETLEAWSNTDTQPDNLITGFAASPGVVEGIARVVKDVSEINDLKEGEILVCPIMAPSWAPIFGKIRGTVTDIGGSMSHAAIVAREYNLPAVVGTGSATKKIKTGQMLRLDGNKGNVLVID
ncbi:MAG: PEP-utilizing protein mobile subunit [Rhodocyclaceae bacterium]|nr:MAG: PEP-utilizing protein mobile subunit [Rhodocyclaceae bacterium]